MITATYRAPRTVSETTGNEISARPYTLPLFLKHTSCWENYAFPGQGARPAQLSIASILQAMKSWAGPGYESTSGENLSSQPPNEV